MTEAEWLTSQDLKKMIDYIQLTCTRRKLALFDCAFCRSVWDIAQKSISLNVLEMAEDCAAGKISSSNAWYMCDVSDFVRIFTYTLYPLRPTSLQSDLLRDIFGNPFYTITINPTWLTWNDGCVPTIARDIYNHLSFDKMPVLADALEDAGCDNQSILAHCRDSGNHVRGCWVIDLLLGKY